MSAGAGAVPVGVRRTGRSASPPAARPLIRLTTFAALGLYGVLRWATLFDPAPTWRLLGLLGLALLLVAVGPALGRRHWALGLAACVVAVLVMFPICGVPLSWMRHVRVELIASGIGQGLSALPGVLLPYNGINVWTHVVILLGAGVLLLDAAVLLAFAGAPVGDVRRAGAALPLVTLAVVPSTLLHPALPYVQGLLLFALLVAFMWGERLPRGDRAGVVGLCALAATGALILAPSLEQHHAWVDYEALAGGLAPSSVDTFDWSQTYGPILWPRRGRTVMDVSARTGEYWKAENLDVFDGKEWTTGAVSTVSPWYGVAPATRRRWTQRIQVTIRTMKINTILAAGAADEPQDVPSPVMAGTSEGTWIASSPLSSGDSYFVSVYDPRPTTGELAHAGGAYPAGMEGYRTIELPSSGGYGPPIGVSFPAFHSSGEPVRAGPFPNAQSGPGSLSEVAPARDVMNAVTQSPYAQAYELARRLAAGSATPDAFVQSVERYLARGYTYDETPPRSAYPLASFLFQSKLGYCQQFAGAMALLLRMGGVPARVAVGFTSGSYQAAQQQWAVTDVDAHAWVEAWFPHYGWVRFDPTPPADPALGGHVPLTPASDFPASAPLPHGINIPSHATPSAPHRPGAGSGGIPPLLWIGLVAAGLAGVGLLVAAWYAGRDRGTDQLVSELERAMARTGRPMAGGMTLAGLEHRVRGSPDAEHYIRALRLARFGTGGPNPTLRQRRTLRAELRAGLGVTGALRALWALPPRWHAPQRVSGARPGA